MKKFYLVPMLLLLGAIGCEQNPTIPKGSNTPPVIPIEVPKTWLIQGEETVFVEEGGAGTGVYVGFVEEPGLPILSAENLPAWMTFDGTTGELVWNPDHAAANDPANPQATSKVYEIGLVLESSVLPQAVVEKKIKVVVLNVPQESQLVANNQTIRRSIP